MKKAVQVLGISLIAVLLVVNISQAQQRGRGFGSQTALVISDILLLDEEKTEKLVTVYGEVQQKLREQRQGGGADFRSMSDEERTKYFEERQKETAAALKKELKEVLSEEQMEIMEDVLVRRLNTTDPELRALRQIELEEEQTAKIRPLAIELSQKMLPGGFRFFGAQQRSDEEREKAEKAFAEAKATFTEKVAAILSEKQNEAWKEKAAEIQKEIDEMRERMRNMRQQQ